MNQSKISVRYARAIFQSALEKNLLERVERDMKAILEICRIAEVREILASPIIVPSKKTEMIHVIFGSDLHKLTSALLELTVKNGRESSIPAIARVFIHETRKHNGIMETVLTTAVKVNPEVRKQISGIITDLFKTKIELRENVDEDIIGGFILKVGDKYYDASIRNKLRRIKKEFRMTSIGTE